MNQEGKRLREDDDVEDRPRVEEENKRVKEDPINELIANVCKDLRRIGETSNLNTQVDDMSYISNPIVVEFEKLDKLRQLVLSTFNAIVTEQPQKIYSLSALILICNAKNFLVPKYVVEYFHTKIQSYLSLEELKDNFNNIKCILKFLCCLSPIIDDSNLSDVLKQFLQLAMDLHEKNATLANEVFYNTLMCIPHLLSNDFDRNVPIANDLVEFALSFPITSTSSELYSNFSDKFNNVNVPYTNHKLIDLILPSLQELKSNNYESLKKLFIDYRQLIDPIIEDSLKANTISNDFIKHKLPQFSINAENLAINYKPSGDSIDGLWAHSPRLAFEIYSYTNDFETLPNVKSFEGIFFKDVCFDLLTNLSFNKNETSIQLSILDLYFNRDLFAPPGLSIDKLQEINEDNKSGENQPPLSTWKIEDIAVESILSMIFQLPKSIELDVYYYAVLIACCKENPESIAPVFGRAIRFLYNNLESLDFETKVKFMDWMTIQISNFEFSWKWDEWVNDSQKFSSFKYHPKKFFIKNLIAKELKLSNKKKIRESFITLDQESNEVKELDEFFKYLNLAVIPNESKYIINYDSELYGNSTEIQELVAKLQFEKKETLNINLSPQLEMFFVFTNDRMPYFNECDRFNKFLLSNGRTNKDFFDIIEQVKNDITNDDINKVKFIINLIFQSYCFIGSRSIYSTISILSRDLTKLKWISGNQLSESDYIGSSEDFRFSAVNLSGEESSFNELQNYIIDSIFRIWIHQPQFIFLILEFLVDSKILSFDILIERVCDLSSNFVTENINCFETINRLLSSFAKKASSTYTEETEADKAKAAYVSSLSKISSTFINNLSAILTQLNIKDDEQIKIESDIEDTNRIDLEWLFFDYLDLLKFVIRKFPVEYNLEDAIATCSNAQLKQQLTSLAAQRV